MIIRVDFKPFDALQLRNELATAGVGIADMGVFGVSPFSVVGSTLSITVADGSDEALVRRVYDTHVAPPDKTPTQIKRERLAASLTATDDASERLKVVIRVLYKSLVETREWCNQLAGSLQAAGMPTPPSLRNRTWEEAVASVMQEIEKEVQP